MTETASSVPTREFPFQAIAAMAPNRVIGHNNSIPWHLPEDFRWFRKTTMGHTLVMGARTFESIGKPLPGRTTWVLSRSQQSIPGVTIFASVEAAIDRVLESGMPARPFICGGEEIYRQALPLCSDLYLTEVRMVPPDGDAFFPEINEIFEISEIITDNCDFRIVHWRNRHYSD